MKLFNVKCSICNKPFISTGANGKYCSICLKYKCDFCKKEFSLSRYAGQFNREFWNLKHFCSKKCRWDYQSKMLLGRKGEQNWNWKGGRIKQGEGYIKIHSYRHPFCDKKGYVFEHRLIMEKYLGRYLEKNEQVHHKNKIKNDNRIENLELVISKNHFGKVKCPKCYHEFIIR